MLQRFGRDIAHGLACSHLRGQITELGIAIGKLRQRGHGSQGHAARFGQAVQAFIAIPHQQTVIAQPL